MWKAVSLPKDSKLLNLFGKWADAWGGWTLKQKRSCLDSPSANELTKKEGEAVYTLKSALEAKGYQDVRILNRTIFFDNGRVQLTH